MALEIANSSVVVVGVDLTDTHWPTLNNSPDNIIAAINDELLGDGLTIGTHTIGFSGLTFALTGNFSATLQILNQSGQELDDTDLQVQFNDACAQEGIQVNGFAPQQIIDGNGVNSGTGVQGNVVTTGAGVAAASGPGGTPVCGDPALTFWKYPEAWITCLTQKGLTTVGLVAIGLLVGIVLIVMVQRRPTPV